MLAVPDSPERDWIEALHRAAARLPGAGDGAHLFRERRTDLRVEVGPRGVREALVTRLHGLSAHSGPEGDRSLFLSDPEPEHAAQLVRSMSGGAPPRGTNPRGARPEADHPALPFWL